MPISAINIGRIVGNTINDPIMSEFTSNLDKINALAESSKGFIWRLKDSENNATSFNPYNDERIIINISVWENIEALQNFAYQTNHADFLKRRKEWFEKFGKAYTCLWWIMKGAFPTVEEAVERLDFFQKNGATERAFDFRTPFKMPLDI
ncbi:MAG: DUF3291 domain-containing protein [Saprospiraceae bacterium]|nr:DUF3291 domain-containing protein [Saprospiraceae bacterium]